MALIKPFQFFPPIYDYAAIGVHWGAAWPNDDTSYHAFGWCDIYETPLGVFAYLPMPDADTAARAAPAMFAMHHAADQLCPWCNGLYPAPTIPRFCTPRPIGRARTYTGDQPYSRQWPPAIYCGQIIYAPPDDGPWIWKLTPPVT